MRNSTGKRWIALMLSLVMICTTLFSNGVLVLGAEQDLVTEEVSEKSVGRTMEEGIARYDYQSADVRIVAELADPSDLPEDAEMVITPTELTPEAGNALEAEAIQEQKAIYGMQAYDIKFLLEGMEVQPAQPVKMIMTLPEISSQDDAVVYHIDNEANLENMQAQVMEDGNVEFSAPHFSTYAVMKRGGSTVTAAVQHVLADGTSILEDTEVQLSVGSNLAQLVQENDAYEPVQENPIVEVQQDGTEIPVNDEYQISSDITVKVYYQEKESLDAAQEEPTEELGKEVTGEAEYGALTATNEVTYDSAMKDNFYIKKSLDGGEIESGDPDIHKWWVQFQMGGTSQGSIEPPPLDVVLIIDRSGSMHDGDRMTQLKETLTKVGGLIDTILPSGTDNQIGIVTYSRDAESYNFSKQASTVKDTISELQPGGDTATSKGIQAARTLFEGLKEDRADSKKVAILLTDGIPGNTVSDTPKSATSYASGILANEQAEKLKGQGVELFTIAYAMGDMSGTTYLGIQKSGSATAIGGATRPYTVIGPDNNWKDSYFGASVKRHNSETTDREEYYYIGNSDFSTAFLRKIASNDTAGRTHCYDSKETTDLKKILEELMELIKNQNVATDITVTDEVSDEYFKYAEENGKPIVQYKPSTVKDNEWKTLPEGKKGDKGDYYYIERKSGESEGGVLCFHLSYVAWDGTAVRFQVQANEGVYSQNSVGTPDLPTNDSAKVDYKDVNDTQKSLESGNYADLNTPYVYIPPKEKMEDTFYIKKSLDGGELPSEDSDIHKWWVKFQMGGTSEQIIEQPPLDVVLIIDCSGSMSESTGNGKDETRMSALKKILKENGGLIDTILPAGTNNQIGIVTYSNSGEQKSYSFSKDSNAVKETVEKIKTKDGGSTATSQGISEARNLFDTLDSSRKKSKKIAILLTDGVPGYYSGMEEYNTNSYASGILADEKATELKSKGVELFTIAYAMGNMEGNTVLGVNKSGSVTPYEGGGTRNYKVNNEWTEDYFGASVRYGELIYGYNYWGPLKKTVYYIENNIFSAAFLRKIASTENHCYDATETDNLKEILHDLADKIIRQEVATNITVTDEVSDAYFKYAIGLNGDPIVQYKASTVKDKEWKELPKGQPGDSGDYYYIKETSGSGEGGVLCFHLSYALWDGTAVRFQVQANEGVHSGSGASQSNPDLPTNDSAKVDYTDANGEPKNHTSEAPEVYPDLQSPEVYIPYLGKENIETAKTASVVNWEDRIYTIDLYASHNLKQDKPVNVMMALDISGSMPWFITKPTGGTIRKDKLPTRDRETLSSYGLTGVAAWKYTYYVLRSGEGGSKEYKPIAWDERGQKWKFIQSDNDGNKAFNSGSDAEVRNDETIYVRGQRDQTKLEALETAVVNFVNNLKAVSPESYVGVTTFAADVKNTESLTKVTELDIQTIFSGLKLYGGTNQASGMRVAYTEIEKATNGYPKNIILFSDGDPGSSYVEESDAMAKVLRENSSISFYTAGIFQDLESSGAKHMIQWANGNSTTKDNAFLSNTPNGLVNSFNKIFGKISIEMTGVTVKDYIDSRFELIDTNGNVLKVGDRVAGGEVGYDDNGWFIIWEDQTLSYAEDPMKGWHAEGILVRAREEYIGGNDITTNGPNSGVYVKNDPDPIPFEQPKVNVKIDFEIKNAAEVIFLGTSAADSMTGQVIKDMVTPSYTKADGTRGYYTDYQDIAGGKAEVVWYTDEACTQKVTAEGKTDGSLDAVKAQANPSETTKYYVKVTVTPSSNGDEGAANTESKKNDSDNGISKTAVFAIDVVYGEIDLAKIIDEKYSDEPIKANQSFVFKIDRYADKEMSKLEGTFYEVINFADMENDGSKVIDRLPKGYYQVTEEKNWSWKYDCMNNTVSDPEKFLEQENASDSTKIISIGETKGSGVEKQFTGTSSAFKDHKVEAVFKNYERAYTIDPATVTFTNEKNSNGWLSDVAVAINKLLGKN